VHFTALKNRFAIELNDSLFDSRTLAVEADGIVVGEKRIADLEETRLNKCGDMCSSLNSPFPSSQNVFSPVFAKNIIGPNSNAGKE
jgi:hypothetical protein